MTVAVLAGGFALALLVAVAVSGRERRRGRLRAAWGASVSRERDTAALAAVHQSRVAATGGGSLDAQTWHDLHMDDVFAVVDRTESTLGQEALYHRLRTAPVGEHLEQFEALVDRMTRDAPARERAQAALGRLQDLHGYDLWWLAAADALPSDRSYAVFPLFTTLAIALAVTVPFWHAAIRPLLAVVAMNVVIRFSRDGRIRHVASAFRQFAPIIATGESLKFLCGASADAALLAPLSHDLPGLHRLKLISRWISSDPLMLPARADLAMAALSQVVESIYEYLNVFFLLTPTGVCLASRDATRHRAALLRVVAAIGDVDAAISVASFRRSRSDWVRPRFLAAGAGATVEEARHPLLATPVANSILLPPGRGVLVTGSNMSGKSTFLRTLGVNAVLAQTLNTCLAASYEAPAYVVKSFIGRSDDLAGGRSYYLAEVQALLALIRASESADPHLILLDELFRGTNAAERIAAGEAVLRELLGRSQGARPHVVVAATHDGELVPLLGDVYAPCHFGDRLGPDGLEFDYRLCPGPATSRNAIALLRQCGAPERVVRRANELLSGPIDDGPPSNLRALRDL